MNLNRVSIKKQCLAPGVVNYGLVLALAACGVHSQAFGQTTTIITTTTATTTVKAASCLFPAVQAAVSVAKAGQTVVVPAGDCDWGANQLTVPTGISMQGAGRNLTTIRRTAAVPANTYLIAATCTTSKPVKFSDMTLVGANLPRSQDRGLGLLYGCVDFVVSNMKFTKFVFAGIEVRGPVRQRGVIHDSEFIDNYNTTNGSLGYGIVVFGDGTWPALELGSQNAVFVEDNYMSGNRHHIAANNGARYVFRYNYAQATQATKDFSQVDAHGFSSSPRGTRSYEVYYNKFYANITSGRNLTAVGIRGGDGVVYNNTYGPNIAYPVLLLLEAATCGTYPVQDQVRKAVIAEAVPNPVMSQCEKSIALNRDYFVQAKAGYKPYFYPHPLRTY
ncbi:hypothetical protein [Pseudoduganella umbonata]|uniref:Right-handed parallel beta-helix repeat-containing protein n=1 Tax=Pseudoduganella umbonata TaxID=864828 RepID=A0A4V1EDX1_9BURK|nr:hypothetical protein [Pseudoduganella umbonata]MBB3222345.1 hypothetical protein [Pseudoduganella umbonata]QCP12561.1 hypothetical protein FCL38_20605 [Pseudoduganella umbonata]